MYLIFASWCERFLLWRNFFFILSALFSYFVASLSFSLVCRSKKAPAPFVFFLTFYLFRTRGPDGSRKGPKLLLFFVVPSASKIKERKKSRQQLFRPRFQSGFVCHQQKSLSFSDCARKSSIATKKTTYSHTRYNSKEKCLSQFPPLLAPESSPRRTAAPLPPREEPPRCKSSRKENYGGFAMFFFSYENRKRKRASARFRALVTSISIDLSNRANAIVVG